VSAAVVEVRWVVVERRRRRHWWSRAPLPVFADYSTARAAAERHERRVRGVETQVRFRSAA
jgi:hypothetical protein